MKKVIVCLLLLVGYVMPAMAETVTYGDPIFWVFPMNEYQESQNRQIKKSKPKKKIKKKAKQLRKRLDDPFEYERKPKRRSVDDWALIHPPEQEIELPDIEVKSSIVDKFVLANGLVNYKRPVIQSEITISFRNGFYIDVWNSVQKEKNKPVETSSEEGEEETEEIPEGFLNPGYELDYTLGWAGEFVLGTDLDIGVTYCDLLKFGRVGSREDLLYTYADLSHKVGAGFALKVMGEKFTVMRDAYYRGGALYSGGVSYNDSFMDEQLFIEGSVEGTYDTGNFGTEKGTLVRGKIGFNWKPVKNLSILFPQVNYYVPLTVRDGYTKTATVTAGFSYRFGGTGN